MSNAPIQKGGIWYLTMYAIDKRTVFSLSGENNRCRLHPPYNRSAKAVPLLAVPPPLFLSSQSSENRECRPHNAPQNGCRVWSALPVYCAQAAGIPGLTPSYV
jgi:hypothetical protein